MNIDNINIKTIPAYNIDKNFHPKSNNWLGYVISCNNITYYIDKSSFNNIKIKTNDLFNSTKIVNDYKYL